MEYTKNQISVSKIADKKSYNPIITGVLLDGNKAVATDSYKLIEIKNKNMEQVAKEKKVKSFIVNASYLKSFKLPAKQDYALISKEKEDEGNANIESGAVSMKLPVLYGEYPDYIKIIPNTPPKAIIQINATFLKDIADILEHINSLSSITIEFRKPNQPLVLRAHSLQEEALALIMPLRS